MAAKRVRKSKALSNPRAYRMNQDMNQAQFWTRYGVTQCSGSRYEIKDRIPAPVAMLMVLLEQGTITAEELEYARATAEANTAK